MLRVMAIDNGEPSFYPLGVTLAGAAAQWATAHQAQQISVHSAAYGHAVVTYALPDQTERRVEFVLAVG